LPNLSLENISEGKRFIRQKERMGGDDLGDDDLLLGAPVRGTSASSSDDEDAEESYGGRRIVDRESGDGSRKRRDRADDDDNSHERDEQEEDYGLAVNGTTKAAASKTKKRAKKSPDQLLVLAGRDIERQSVEEQAAFLTTAIRHYSLLDGIPVRSTEDDVDDGGGGTGPTTAAAATTIVRPGYLRKRHESGSFVDTIREAVSIKQLKKWKKIGSPCVVCFLLHTCMGCMHGNAQTRHSNSLPPRVYRSSF
jgi:hypothetical protein